MCAQKRQILSNLIDEPHRKKPVFGVSDQVRHIPGCTASENKIEAQDFGFMNQGNRTIYVAKTRTMINSCAVIESLFLHMENSVFLMTGLK